MVECPRKLKYEKYARSRIGHYGTCHNFFLNSSPLEILRLALVQYLIIPSLDKGRYLITHGPIFQIELYTQHSI